MDKRDLKSILDYLESLYRSSFFERSKDPFYVLIFTVLSQRTRDENTEKVTADLFKVYGTPKELADADLEKVEQLIRASGFYRVKARRIIRISQELIDRFDGKVPEDIDDLLSLRGVGRKTANCVLVYGFRKPAIPVDTHVHRISNRLGLISTKTPEESEKALEKVLPKESWIRINEFMVKFGQQQCFPLRPLCSRCDLTDICPFYRKNKGTMLVR